LSEFRLPLFADICHFEVWTVSCYGEWAAKGTKEEQSCS